MTQRPSSFSHSGIHTYIFFLLNWSASSSSLAVDVAVIGPWVAVAKVVSTHAGLDRQKDGRNGDRRWRTRFTEVPPPLSDQFRARSERYNTVAPAALHPTTPQKEPSAISLCGETTPSNNGQRLDPPEISSHARFSCAKSTDHWRGRLSFHF